MACCQVNLKRRQPIHFHRFPQLPNFNKRRKRTQPLLPGSLNGRTSCAFFRLFPCPGRSNFILFYISFIGPESQCYLLLQFFATDLERQRNWDLVGRRRGFEWRRHETSRGGSGVLKDSNFILFSSSFLSPPYINNLDYSRLKNLRSCCPLKPLSLQNP